jgi:hypothetical protein
MLKAAPTPVLTKLLTLSILFILSSSLALAAPVSSVK